MASPIKTPKQTSIENDDIPKGEGAGAVFGHNMPLSVAAGEGGVILAPISCLRTTYAHLRPGNQPGKLDDLRPLPLRVVPAEGSAFEIIDGFKRAAAWKVEGREQIPVIVESPGSAADHKRRLLLANAPQRTLNPLDEGLVARSLLEDDGLTATAAAKLLGHKKKWIVQRISLTQKLSIQAQQWMTTKKIGPTLAHYLTSLPPDDQDKLLECFSHHRVPGQQRTIIVQAYRVADAIDRGRLLAAPLSVLPTSSSPTLSPTGYALEKRLENVSRALTDLESFRIPADVSSAEQRRLEALSRTLVVHMRRALSTIETMFDVPNSSLSDESVIDSPNQQKEIHHALDCAPADAGKKPRSLGSEADLGTGTSVQHKENCQVPGPLAETHNDGARGGGPTSASFPDNREQAHPLSRGLGGAGRQESYSNENSARAQRTRLSGRPHDSRGGGESIAGSTSSAEAPGDQASL